MEVQWGMFLSSINFGGILGWKFEYNSVYVSVGQLNVMMLFCIDYINCWSFQRTGYIY